MLKREILNACNMGHSVGWDDCKSGRGNRTIYKNLYSDAAIAKNTGQQTDSAKLKPGALSCDCGVVWVYLWVPWGRTGPNSHQSQTLRLLRRWYGAGVFQFAWHQNTGCRGMLPPMKRGKTVVPSGSNGANHQTFRQRETNAIA